IPQSCFIIVIWDMDFPSFSIRRGLLEIRISCPFFCVHKNSADETQLNLTNTIYYRTMFSITYLFFYGHFKCYLTAPYKALSEMPELLAKAAFRSPSYSKFKAKASCLSASFRLS